MSQMVAMEGGCFGIVACQVVSKAGAKKMGVRRFLLSLATNNSQARLLIDFLSLLPIIRLINSLGSNSLEVDSRL